MQRPPKVWTIVVGGGSAQRYGQPKQYESLGRERVIDRSKRIAGMVSDGVIVVVPAIDAEREGGVAGGRSRSESVRAGLAAVPPEADVICVHDAARPLASVELYEAVVSAIVDGADGAIPGIPVTDTIKVVGTDGTVTSTPNRASLMAVQTPQAFSAVALRAAHAAGGDGTDDAALVEQSGGRVVVVPGEADNRKITVPDDLAWIRSAIMETGSFRDEERSEE